MNNQMPYFNQGQVPYMFPGTENVPKNIENLNNLEYKINMLEEKVKKIENKLNMNTNNMDNFNPYNSSMHMM